MLGGYLIAFETQKSNNIERQYTMQEKEIIIVVHCLYIWRHYLLESKFLIKIENMAKRYFQTQKELTPKQVRWQEFLVEFDYIKEYKPSWAV